MARSRAWQEFQVDRPEIAQLLAVAAGLPDTIEADERISKQEMILRLAMVAIIAALHRYLATLLEDWADKLVDDWDTLSLLQKRFVVVHVRRGLERLVAEFSEGALWEEKDQKRFRLTALKFAEWLQKPTVLAASPEREELTGFFRDQGAKSIDRALSRFRGDGKPFFGWLLGQNAGYAGYEDRLNEVITVRNEVAHGILNRRLTMLDVREHWAFVTVMTRKAEDFLR